MHKTKYGVNPRIVIHQFCVVDDQYQLLFNHDDNPV